MAVTRPHRKPAGHDATSEADRERAAGRDRSSAHHPAHLLAAGNWAAAQLARNPAAFPRGLAHPAVAEVVARAQQAGSLRDGVAEKATSRRTPMGVARRALQRDVGFEYEVNRETYQANAPVSLANRRIASMGHPAWSAGPTLGKGQVLVGNMGGVHAKTDLGGAWNDTNLELEVDQVPETAAGRNTLLARLRTIEIFCSLLDDERQAGFHHISAAKFAAALGGNAPLANAYIHAWGGHTAGNPQATAGVRLDQIAQLMERAVGGPTGGPLAIGVHPPLRRLELGRTPANIADFGLVGDAPRHVRTGIAAYVAAGMLGANPPAGFPSPELVSLCALILPYIVRGAGPAVAFAKQIAPLMARTDFGQMFANDVPGAETAWLSGMGGARFRGMWSQILIAAGVGGGVGAPLFAAEPGAALGAELPAALTRAQWLNGIAAGNDLLTSANIHAVAAGPLTPAQAQVLTASGNVALLPANAGAPATLAQTNWLTQHRQVQLFGLGGMGGAHDVVNPGPGAVNAPIIELRRMLQGVDPHDFTEMALGIFDYIRALNATAAGGVAAPYQRTHRNIAAPNQGELVNFLAA